MKKFLISLFAVMLMTASSINAAEKYCNLTLNNKPIKNAAVIKNGRTLVGVRGVFEELGYTVDYDNATSTATLKSEKNTVIISNNKTYFTVNGNKYYPDVPQQIINSKFYLPLRAVGNALGAYVDWNKKSETAIINNTNIPEEAIAIPDNKYQSVSQATPGVHTIKNLLLTALMPVGKTMYIYGGGWNEADNGAGIEAVTIGLSPKWQEFTDKQTSAYKTSNYDYKKDVSVIHLGLDCSGYMGWAIYNTLNTENNLNGYVDSSKKIAGNLASLGWGSLTAKNKFTDYKAGDIMSASCTDCAHVWLAVGQCSDGSVVFLHSSPNGVMLSGTYTKNGNKNSEAVKLASEYMAKYFSSWYSRYPNISRNASYLTHYDRFRWSLGTKLADPEGLTDMSAKEILAKLFNEN